MHNESNDAVQDANVACRISVTPPKGSAPDGALEANNIEHFQTIMQPSLFVKMGAISAST